MYVLFGKENLHKSIFQLFRITAGMPMSAMSAG